MTSFIVSAYDRPEHLKNVLQSLKLQTRKDFEVIVTDNATDPFIYYEQKTITEELGFTYYLTQAPECYSSADLGVAMAQGEYVCFPSDDDYYVPQFLELMMEAIEFEDLDLVYCNALFDIWGGKTYQVLSVEPRVSYIDKGGFIVRKALCTSFPYKEKAYQNPFPCDGLFIEQLVKAGVKHAKIDPVLFVHN